MSRRDPPAAPSPSSSWLPKRQRPQSTAPITPQLSSASHAANNRTHRELADEDIAKIADAYHAWRGEPGTPPFEDVPGFCASASVAQIAEHRFVLTPGRYIGTEEADDDGEPIQEKLARFKGELFSAFDESDRLQVKVRAALERIDG